MGVVGWIIPALPNPMHSKCQNERGFEGVFEEVYKDKAERIPEGY